MGQVPYSPPNLTTGDGTEAFYVYDSAHGISMPGALMEKKDRATDTRLSYDGRGRITRIDRQIAVPTATDTLTSRYETDVLTKTFGYTEANQQAVTSTGADASALLVGNVSQVSTAYNYDGAVQSLSSSYGSLLTSQHFQITATGSVVTKVFGDVAATTATVVADMNGLTTGYTLSRSAAGPWLTSNPSYTPPTGVSTLQQVLTNLVVTNDGVGNPLSMTEGNLGPQGTAEWPAGAQAPSKALTYGDDYRLTRALSNYGGGNDVYASPYTTGETSAGTYPPPVPRGAGGAVTPPVDRPRSQTFSYDARGNMTGSVDDAFDFYDRSLGTILNGTQTATIGATQYSAVNNPDQFSIASSDGYSSAQAWYDLAGNVIQVQTRDRATDPVGTSVYQYTWDEVGRLSSANRLDNGSRLATHEVFSYDAGGQRVVTGKSPSLTGPYTYTVGVFDSLVLEDTPFSGADGVHGDYARTALTEDLYLSSGGMGAAHAFYKQDDTPLASSGKVHVFMTFGDPLGSTSFIVDHDTSEVVERMTYQPYGAVESDYRPARWDAFREDVRHTGHWDDAEVGLTYFGARFYNPHLARWMSPDPLTIHGLGADPNPYAFVQGSPIGHVDPWGLEDCSGTAGKECAPPGTSTGSGTGTIGVAAAAIIATSYVGYEFATSASAATSVANAIGDLFRRGGPSVAAPPTFDNTLVHPQGLAAVTDVLASLGPTGPALGLVKAVATLASSSASAGEQAVAGIQLAGAVVPGGEAVGELAAAADAVAEGFSGTVAAAEGTATVFQYGTSHASVLVQVGDDALHTEQVLTDVGTTIAERAGAEGASRGVQVALPNGQAALAYQRGVLGTATGEYNLATNSCVTHCGDVLRAGAVSGVPTTTRGIFGWLRSLLGGP
jgi:RHS repeat-associated protein